MQNDLIRAEFSKALSQMYREEVPAYGTLLDIVERVNNEAIDASGHQDSASRVSVERHGAIRLGSGKELSMMRRVFAVMGMYPVGYYDLSGNGLPVHSTAFRPITDEALEVNPFRVFTSLLRLELIEDGGLRDRAREALDSRKIFSDKLVELVQRAEEQGELSEEDAQIFVAEAIKTFRWRSEAHVSKELYDHLNDLHRLIADIVSFKGPHINHLTPRTLDIDKVQKLMPEYEIAPKAVVEGPPKRKCPIFLRQTSFKALSEQVEFKTEAGDRVTHHHTARFGEIEQRGVALTIKGRDLYNSLLAETREHVSPNPDGSNAEAYYNRLADTFKAFPDDWQTLRLEGLAHFEYQLSETGKAIANGDGSEGTLEDHILSGYVLAKPITYEDFLPVSAAGIFRSNLDDDTSNHANPDANKDQFEIDLGRAVYDDAKLYAEREEDSKRQCLNALAPMVRAHE